MAIYAFLLIMGLAPAWLGVATPRKWTVGLVLYLVVLQLFLGLRFQIGVDWRAYEGIFESYSYYRLDEALTFTEPGYFVINRLCDALGLGFQGVVFFCALIFLWGCFSFARTTSDPWMAVAVVLPYLVFVVGGSGIRQSTAIGVGFYLVAHNRDFSLLARLALIALAASFHSSAVLLLTFVIVPMRAGILVRGALLAVLAVVIVTVAADSTAAERYNSVYLTKNVISDGALYHVLLVAVPAAVYLIVRQRIRAKIPEEPSVHLATYLAVLAVPMISVSSTGVDRMTLYLSFVQMWVYPALTEAQLVPRSISLTLVTLITFATFLVYFIFGAHAHAYVPYHNFLFL